MTNVYYSNPYRRPICAPLLPAPAQNVQPRWLVPQPQPSWLDREALAFSRALATSFGYSGWNTLSTEVGYDLGRRLGVSIATTKRWFHYGIGGFVGLLASWFGAPAIAAVGFAAAFAAWLEHFDGAGR